MGPAHRLLLQDTQSLGIKTKARQGPAARVTHLPLLADEVPCGHLLDARRLLPQDMEDAPGVIVRHARLHASYTVPGLLKQHQDAPLARTSLHRAPDTVTEA